MAPDTLPFADVRVECGRDQVPPIADNVVVVTTKGQPLEGVLYGLPGPVRLRGFVVATPNGSIRLQVASSYQGVRVENLNDATQAEEASTTQCSAATTTSTSTTTIPVTTTPTSTNTTASTDSTAVPVATTARPTSTVPGSTSSTSTSTVVDPVPTSITTSTTAIAATSTTPAPSGQRLAATGQPLRVFVLLAGVILAAGLLLRTVWRRRVS